MDALIPSLLSAATDTSSLLLLMFLLVVSGTLVPRWRYNELKEDLKEYEQTSKSLLIEFKDLAALVAKGKPDGDSDPNGEGGGNEST